MQRLATVRKRPPPEVTHPHPSRTLGSVICSLTLQQQELCSWRHGRHGPRYAWGEAPRDDASSAPLGRHPDASCSCVGQLRAFCKGPSPKHWCPKCIYAIDALCFAFTQGMGGDCSGTRRVARPHPYISSLDFLCTGVSPPPSSWLCVSEGGGWYFRFHPCVRCHKNSRRQVLKL